MKKRNNMKINITYRKISKETGQESVQNYEMDYNEAQMNLIDAFRVVNIEKSNNITKLEVWQAEQYIINVNASEDKVQTLHLKFYDFDIFLDFVLVKK